MEVKEGEQSSGVWGWKQVEKCCMSRVTERVEVEKSNNQDFKKCGNGAGIDEITPEMVKHVDAEVE